MTLNEFKRRFPRASGAAVRLNVDPAAQGLCAGEPEPVTGLSLGTTAQGEVAGRSGAAARYRVIFTVYAVRPCDWDNYRTKDLQDWLVRVGILPDDNWKLLEGQVVSRKARSRAEEMTVVDVTRIL